MCLSNYVLEMLKKRRYKIELAWCANEKLATIGTEMYEQNPKINNNKIYLLPLQNADTLIYFENNLVQKLNKHIFRSSFVVQPEYTFICSH